MSMGLGRKEIHNPLSFCPLFMALLFLEYLLLIDLQGFGVTFVLLSVREHWNSTGPTPSKYPVLARNKFLYLIWTCMSTALPFLFSSVQHNVLSSCSG